jgi:hypothetical protein
MLAKLMRAVGRVSLDNLKLTESDSIPVDQIKRWAGQIISLVERIAPDEAFRREFISNFAHLFIQ